jgi:hypothetical protein
MIETLGIKNAEKIVPLPDEQKPRDPTIAAKFNTYRFAEHKESMIDLLARVVRVSVDTVAITEAMLAATPITVTVTLLPAVSA